MEENQKVPCSPWWSRRLGDVGKRLPGPDYGLDLPKRTVGQFDYGAQLRLVRQAAGLSQTELASLVGTNRNIEVHVELSVHPQPRILDRFLKPLGLRTRIIFVPIEGATVDKAIIELLAELE
jgi:DNA-binding XRE family transcriptional regulator